MRIPRSLPTLDEVRSTPSMALFVEALRSAGHPDPERGVPAREEDIARLEGIARRPLPPLYLAFLRRFGEAAPISLAIGDGRPALSDVLAYYARDRDAAAGGEVVIAAPCITEATALLYGDAEEPAVGHPDGPPVAPSFAHHLYRRGWTQSLPPDAAQLTIAGADVEAVALEAEAAGFERLWFSGGDARCLDGAIVQLHLRQEATCARVFVLSRLERERDRWAAFFQRKHEVTRRFR